MNQLAHHPLCEQFLGWQCRIRQHAVRKQEGRPPRGVSAAVKIDGSLVDQIATIICKEDSEDVTAEFRFMVQQTVDPRKRYESALKFLCEYYYQFPKEFDSRPTALFGLDDKLVKTLVDAKELVLDYSQTSQRYQLVCSAVNLPPGRALYEATYWHNHLFNPNMPGVVTVLGFEIDWDRSTFEEVVQ